MGRTATRGVLRTARSGVAICGVRTSSEIGVASGILTPSSATVAGNGGAGGQHRGVGAEDRAVGRADAGDAAVRDDDLRAAGVGADLAAVRDDHLREVVDQRRELDPALTRVEDGPVVGDGGDVDARRARGDLVAAEPLGVVTDLPHVLEGVAVLSDLALGPAR